MKYLLVLFLSLLNIYANSSANKVANLSKANFGNTGKLKQNAFTPLSTNSNMKTLDGSKEFETQVSCPSNEAAIKVSFVVNSNNSFSLNINQDSNLDGTYDNNTSYVGIDGTCTNGFIRSNPTGAWGTLKYYKWVSTSKGIISAITSSYSEMGSCVCTNSSCNAKFGKSVMDSISGGIVAAITGTAHKLQIGNAKTDEGNKYFNLFLQDNDSCKKVKDDKGYGSESPTQNYKNQSFNTSIADVEAEQGSDKYSIYSMVTEQNKVKYSNGNSKIDIPNSKDCIVKKKVNIFNGVVSLREENTCLNVGTNCKTYYEEICEYDGSNCLETIFKGNSTSITVDTKIVSIKENETIYNISANGTNISYTNGSSTKNLYNGSDSWFYIKRRLTCDAKSKNMNRDTSSNVIGSVDFDRSNTFLNYKNQFGQNRSVDLPDAESCMQKFCSIKRAQNSSDVFADGTNRDDTTSSSTVYQLDYKLCTESGTKYTCSLDDREILVEDCSCEIGQAGFATAVGAMNALEEATKDFICSGD